MNGEEDQFVELEADSDSMNRRHASQEAKAAEFAVPATTSSPTSQ